MAVAVFRKLVTVFSTVLGKKDDFKKHLVFLKCRSVYLKITATKLGDLLG
jgi:hypothetical protein